MARISLISRLVNTTLSYLFTGLACLAYALALQVLFEWTTVGLQRTTLATLAGATLLTATLRYLQLRFYRDQMPAARSRRFKLAAVVGAAVPVVVLLFLASQLVTTGASQWQNLSLADGSIVHLDARTRLKVDYSDATRIVRLYRGAAVFDVAKEPQRPFIVRTSLVDTVAVGTTFGVSVNSGVTTTVSEGIVKVSRRGEVDAAPVAVAADQELVSDRSHQSPHLMRVDAKRKLDWANGWLEINGLTVAQALEEFNRRNRVQIVLENPALGTRRIRGYARLRVDSPVACASLIARWNDFNMTSDSRSDVILLSE